MKSTVLYLPNAMKRETDHQARLDWYLECLMAPLVGVVPFETRRRWREETRFHLERLQADFREDGLSEEEAWKVAFAAYGEPEKLSRDFLESYVKKQNDGHWARKFGYGNLVAFAVLATASLVCIMLLQFRVFLPSDNAWTYAVDPALFQAIFGETFPVPEFSLLYILSVLTIAIGPWFAGWAIGSRVAIDAARATYQGLLPCIAYSLVAGVLLLPTKEILLFGLGQVFYWLPIATISAHYAAIIKRQANMRREARAFREEAA